MNEAIPPGMWVLIAVGALYAPRPARLWAQNFIRKRMGVRPKEVFRFNEFDPEWELEQLLNKAAWQGYWKGVILMGVALLTEEFLASNSWWRIGVYAVIAISVLFRSVNKKAPHRLWGAQ